MKKTILMAGIAISLFAFNANALDFNPYVSVKATYTDLKADLNYKSTWFFETESQSYDIGDKDLGGAIAFGSAFQAPYGNIRAELEYNKKADTESSYVDWGDVYKTKIETQSFMLNAYYDINTGTKFTHISV